MICAKTMALSSSQVRTPSRSRSPVREPVESKNRDPEFDPLQDSQDRPELSPNFDPFVELLLWNKAFDNCQAQRRGPHAYQTDIQALRAECEAGR